MDGSQQNTLLYAGLMLCAGIGIPIMAALNAGLSSKFQSPALAAIVLCIVGMAASALYLLAFEGIPRQAAASGVPVYFYLGGLFLILYLMGIAWVAPRFGIGNAVAFVLLGQLISMTVIDQFGLFGAPQNPVNLQRLAGLLLMAIGVFLVVRR